MAYFQLDKKAMQFDCLVINNGEIVEEYVFYPNKKLHSELNNLVKLVCDKFKPFLKDENISALVKAISVKAIR